ncbi:MAG: hypothetical protein AB1700_08735 [Bacillota bacterium]
MLVVLLVVSFVVMVAYEAPEMIRQKQWEELALFIGLVLFAFTVSFLQVIGVPIPSPVKGIEYLTSRMLSLFQQAINR